MATPEETFAAFVDTVAAALDEPPVDGTELAARMHVSRFHLDRILSGVAGEAPAHFRRRALLERAAYQLATGTRAVLDIAFEAGYSSHEAFTRAFRRAYGQSPSSWRQAPGRWHQSTPNGVHFHPPGGLRLPARAKVTSVDLTVTMIEHHLHVTGLALERARTLTHEQLDAPIELSVMGIDADPRVTVEAGRLDDTFVDATGDEPYVFTSGAMLAHVLTYAVHRRTLVVGALASAGADLNDDPLVWPPLSP